LLCVVLLLKGKKHTLSAMVHGGMQSHAPRGDPAGSGPPPAAEAADGLVVVVEVAAVLWWRAGDGLMFTGWQQVL
jgi:hypothetical protein